MKSTDAAVAAIGAATRELKLPTIRTNATRLAEIAERERSTHLAFLAECLATELDERSERRRKRRIVEAHSKTSTSQQQEMVSTLQSWQHCHLSGFSKREHPWCSSATREQARVTC